MGRFSLAENHFGKPFAQCAMMINTSKSQIFEGKSFQEIKCAIDFKCTTLYTREKIIEASSIHD
jgi:hypothetical protein